MAEFCFIAQVATIEGGSCINKLLSRDLKKIMNQNTGNTNPDNITVAQHLENLLSMKWTRLENYRFPKTGNTLGVYVISYLETDLENVAIAPDHIFYVGQSNNVPQRVRQFKSGVERNDVHNAAKRFYRTYLQNRPYSQSQDPRRLYIATYLVLCTTERSTRTHNDLRIIGDIHKLEYEIMAFVKERTGQEPLLNEH